MDIRKARINMRVMTPVGEGLIIGRGMLHGKHRVIVSVMSLQKADRTSIPPRPGRFWNVYHLPPGKVIPLDNRKE